MMVNKIVARQSLHPSPRPDTQEKTHTQTPARIVRPSVQESAGVLQQPVPLAWSIFLDVSPTWFGNFDVKAAAAPHTDIWTRSNDALVMLPTGCTIKLGHSILSRNLTRPTQSNKHTRPWNPRQASLWKGSGLQLPDMLTPNKCTQHVLHGGHATDSKNVHHPVGQVSPKSVELFVLRTAVTQELPHPPLCAACHSTTAMTRSAWAQRCQAHVRQCKHGRDDIYPKAQKHSEINGRKMQISNALRNSGRSCAALSYVYVVPPHTAFPRTGPRVPWVSLPGPTGVHPG